MPIALIVHGGAWNIPDDEVAAHQAGCRAALRAGWQVLAQGGSALEALGTHILTAKVADARRMHYLGCGPMRSA